MADIRSAYDKIGNNWIGCEGIGYFNKISLALNKISLGKG